MSSGIFANANADTTAVFICTAFRCLQLVSSCHDRGVLLFCSLQFVHSNHKIFVGSQVYLHQLADTHGSAVLPPAVIRILNAKACRSAIMFGDPLLPSECAQLVSSLKATRLCFSCAHGRPTMAPLVNLQALRNQILVSGTSVFAAKAVQSDKLGLQDRLHKLLSK